MMPVPLLSVHASRRLEIGGVPVELDATFGSMMMKQPSYEAFEKTLVTYPEQLKVFLVGGAIQLKW